MPVGIAAFTPVVGSNTQLEGFGPAMAAITLLSLPSLLIFFLLQRFFIEGISQPRTERLVKPMRIPEKMFIQWSVAGERFETTLPDGRPLHR